MSAAHIDVRIEKIVYGGDGLGRADGQAVFVPFTAPGDMARVRVVERKKGFLRAELVEILEPGPGRREAPCPYFGPCGGCQLQHLTYEAQREAKIGFVSEALRRTGRIDWPHPISLRAAPDHEFGYRTRATGHIEAGAAAREGGATFESGATSEAGAMPEAGAAEPTRFGFYAHKSHRVVDIESCPLLVPELDAAWRAVRAEPSALARARDVELAAGDRAVAAHPPVAGVGGRDLEAIVLGRAYRFGPRAFFQVNRFMLEALVLAAVGGEAGEETVENAIDLYSGVGLFTIPLAERARRVVAVEADAGAVAYARENCAAAGATGVEFRAEPVERWLERARGPVDLALLDPPRGGLGVDASRALARLRPGRIVYVSCDPNTLARDLRAMLDAGYELESVEALDLFPQTYHVETVARLRLPAGRL